MLEKYKGTLEIQWSFLAFHTYVICLVLFFLFFTSNVYFCYFPITRWNTNQNALLYFFYIKDGNCSRLYDDAVKNCDERRTCVRDDENKKSTTLVLVTTFYFYLFNPISADLFFSFFSYGFRKKSKIINIFDFLPPQAVFRTISLYSIKNKALGGRGRRRGGGGQK